MLFVALKGFNQLKGNYYFQSILKKQHVIELDRDQFLDT